MAIPTREAMIAARDAYNRQEGILTAAEARQVAYHRDASLEALRGELEEAHGRILSLHRALAEALDQRDAFAADNANHAHQQQEARRSEALAILHRRTVAAFGVAPTRAELEAAAAWGSADLVGSPGWLAEVALLAASGSPDVAALVDAAIEKGIA